MFCYLTYGSRTTNRIDSLYQIVNGLVGNVDWGESLTVAACDFPGLKIFGEKENTIQLLKKKLKIPATQLIQASKLTVLEREKELLSQELNDSKAKLLKLNNE